MVAIALNVAACYLMARPVAGLGILLPALVPGCLAALVALLLAGEHAPPVAFCAGVLGPLIGADLLHIRDLGRRPEDSRIVGAMIQLAHGLDMEVVAEGVEEEEQMVILEMLYCDKMQGFLFSRPLEAQAFESLMDASIPFRTGQSPSRAPAAR